jgi:hypothetical protein
VSLVYNTLILIIKYRYSEKSFNYARPRALLCYLLDRDRN